MRCDDLLIDDGGTDPADLTSDEGRYGPDRTEGNAIADDHTEAHTLGSTSVVVQINHDLVLI